MNDLLSKISKMDTIPFWGFTIFIMIVYFVLNMMVTGGGFAYHILNFLAGGAYGYFVVVPRYDTEEE